MKIKASVTNELAVSTRMRQVCSMFDAEPAEKTSRTWSGEVPLDERDWQVGLIVGPSGSGKSTVARQMFGAAVDVQWNANASVIDDFPKKMPIGEITEALSAVGFSTIPSWVRPRYTLSNGEGFRADLARVLAEQQELAWVDEFTSVVDRQVAKIASHAVQKYVRKRPGRRFVAVGCHYDVIDWLQPDWTLEPATMTFTWRSLQRRPPLELEIRRCSYSTWEIFAPYHYMSAALNRGARCFAAYVDGRPVAFAGMLPIGISQGKEKGGMLYRCSRLVTLPDWQGVGLSFALIDTVAAAHGGIGLRVRTYPAHPSLTRSFQRSPMWAQRKEAGKFSPVTTSETASTPGMGGRPCAVFEYVGAALSKEDGKALLGYGR